MSELPEGTEQDVGVAHGRGRLDVRVGVDEGNDRVTRVSLLVDGEEAAFQNFAG